MHVPRCRSRENRICQIVCILIRSWFMLIDTWHRGSNPGNIILGVWWGRRAKSLLCWKQFNWSNRIIYCAEQRVHDTLVTCIYKLWAPPFTMRWVKRVWWRIKQADSQSSQRNGGGVLGNLMEGKILAFTIQPYWESHPEKSRILKYI